MQERFRWGDFPSPVGNHIADIFWRASKSRTQKIAWAEAERNLRRAMVFVSLTPQRSAIPPRQPLHRFLPRQTERRPTGGIVFLNGGIPIDNSPQAIHRQASLSRGVESSAGEWAFSTAVCILALIRAHQAFHAM